MASQPLEVTLYHYPLTRSTRPLWLLHELGGKVKFTCKRVELMKGEAYSPEFVRMNPNHALPVLLYKDDSGVEQALFESCAIGVLDRCVGCWGISPANWDLEWSGRVQDAFPKCLNFSFFNFRNYIMTCHSGNGHVVWMLRCPTG